MREAGEPQEAARRHRGPGGEDAPRAEAATAELSCGRGGDFRVKFMGLRLSRRTLEMFANFEIKT